MQLIPLILNIIPVTSRREVSIVHYQKKFRKKFELRTIRFPHSLPQSLHQFNTTSPRSPQSPQSPQSSHHFHQDTTSGVHSFQDNSIEFNGVHSLQTISCHSLIHLLACDSIHSIQATNRGLAATAHPMPSYPKL